MNPLLWNAIGVGIGLCKTLSFSVAFPAKDVSVACGDGSYSLGDAVWILLRSAGRSVGYSGMAHLGRDFRCALRGREVATACSHTTLALCSNRVHQHVLFFVCFSIFLVFFEWSDVRKPKGPNPEDLHRSCKYRGLSRRMGVCHSFRQK